MQGSTSGSVTLKKFVWITELPFSSKTNKNAYKNPDACCINMNIIINLVQQLALFYILFYSAGAQCHHFAVSEG